MAVDKKKIENLLSKYFKITGQISISDNGLVSVVGSVDLEKKCEKLPVSFDLVSGNFYCAGNHLITLEGSPRRVGDTFFCYNNQLTTLEGGPKWVQGDFGCHNNNLTNLEGAPMHVGGFSCEFNELTTLKGAPTWISGDFKCYRNLLTTLEYAPRWVGGEFWCFGNPLESLKGIPLYIGNEFCISYNKMLPLCQIISSKSGSIDLVGSPADVIAITEKYRNTGYSGILPFSAELIRAGYKDNAWF
jgi:hypothetical protein